MNIRKLLQNAAALAGYRIVARHRDPQTALNAIVSDGLDTVVDVGANTGQTCIEWLRASERTKVYAFEPMPATLERLRRNTEAWSDRIKVYGVAASDHSGTQVFEVHADHTSSSSLNKRTSESARLLPFTNRVEYIEVSVDRLDAVLEAELSAGLGKTLLKLDVQGHELSVMVGAKALLAATHYVLVEVNLLPLYEGQPTFTDLASHLAQAGFRFLGVSEQFHLENGRPVFLDAIFERCR